MIWVAKNMRGMCRRRKETPVKTMETAVSNGVIVHSDLLAGYIKKHYPNLYLVSSTTKVLTDFNDFLDEVKREDFQYVVPDFRLNKAFDKLAKLTDKEKDKVEFLCNECCWFGCYDRKNCYEIVSRQNLGEDCSDHVCVAPDFRLNKVFDKLVKLTDKEKDKVEFLCNECCWFGCYDRKNCYEIVSRQNLGEDCPDHVCVAPDSQSGYRFSKAMENPAFISVDDIRNTYMPMGFSNFKIEGRGLGSALVLEFLLYYMIKPEYQIHVREEIYLDNMLDIF